MELEKRLSALDRIYRIYDEFAARLDLACQKKCAHCCTPHVTLTTLSCKNTGLISNHALTALMPPPNIAGEWSRSFKACGKLSYRFFQNQNRRRYFDFRVAG